MRTALLAFALVTLLGCGDDSSNGNQGFFYSDACPSRLFPVGTTCEPDLMEIEDPNHASCESLGIASGDPCRDDLNRCTFIKPCVDPANPSQVVLEANYLYCQLSEPNADNCPISRRAAKHRIRYLNEKKRAGLAKEVLDLDLAEYRYLPSISPAQETTIGFIIDDVPASSFVDHERGRVNMYSYVSALVATVQQQQSQIDRLEKQVTELQAEIKTRRR